MVYAHTRTGDTVFISGDPIVGGVLFPSIFSGAYPFDAYVDFSRMSITETYLSVR